ncbi:MAG: DMT family transporter [Rhodospirillaceae bacterium]|jgi:drug/metabolite transporter (DMT)-like permease|nr:DMT family transporter [Rhodospirillaceae bacterium]MBT5373570.1 DMT family transporter [Rhodospirillaceae bacterium]MBT5751107.1 DMT family transporter [Rhodospirillaceae bacterium]
MARFFLLSRSLADKIGNMPVSLRGAGWMLLSAACFAAMASMIRISAHSLHPFQIAFFRCFFGFLILAPWLFRSGLGVLKTRRIGFYALRGAIGAVTMLAWFMGLSLMPLAEAVALGFTVPLFVTLGAALFFGEKMHGRRIIALIAGFIGALIILRPGSGLFDLGAAIILFSALTMAAANLMVKDLARTEPIQAVVTYMTIIMAPLTLVPALFVWRTPSGEELAFLFALAGFATLGNFSLTRAVSTADASAVMPFDYARLPFAALIGYFVFSELPDLWTWVGAGVIALASLFIAHREARAERHAREHDGDGGKKEKIV